MLLELQVQNLVIIERAELRPEGGLCVISGETGAGKSLLMDALALLRGERATARLIGPAGEEAWASAVIQAEPASIADLAEAYGIACDDGQVVLRRRVTRSGRSQAWINDVPVAVAALRTFGERLIDIRAQHEHLRLADAGYQRDMLDAFGGLREPAGRYRTAAQRCRELAAELRSLEEGEADSLRERDFTRFLLEEIEAFDPQPGELQRLEDRQRLLSGAEEWRQLVGEAGEALLEADGSVVEVVGSLVRRLQEAPEPSLREARELLAQAGELIGEAARSCVAAGEAIEVDEEERVRCEQRLAELLDLIRKHGGSEESLHASWQQLAERLRQLEGIDDHRRSAERSLAQASAERDELAASLRKGRAQAFKRLAKRVHAVLAELGMPRARLSMIERPGEGADVQEWLLQTNPGLEPAPLSQVASGGESARVALAVASVCAEHDPVPVLVFDEVDSGVGGRLGLAIARQLRHLSPGRSVLAITHTPQIAALADRHYRVSKEHAAERTAILVDEMVGDERIGELAEMLGGGAAAREQAIALLEMEPA